MVWTESWPLCPQARVQAYAMVYAIVYDFTQDKALFVYGLNLLVRCLLLFEGVVGRTDEGAGLHVAKTHVTSQLFVFGKFLRMHKPQHRQTLINRARPNAAIKSWHRLHVMVQNVRTRRDYGLQSGAIAAKIRN